MADFYQGITVFGLNALDGTALYGTLGSPIPTQAVLVAGSDGTNLQALKTNASGVLQVSASAPSDVTATGSITSNQTFSVSTQGASTVGFNITGTWTGTIDFEVSQDGTNWVAANAYGYSPFNGGATSTTGNGQWVIPVGGLNMFRLRGATVATGSATVWIEAGAGNNTVFVAQPVGSQLNVSAQQNGSWTVTANQGTSPWVTSVSGTVAVTQSTTPWIVAGQKTNNNAAPNGSNVGVLSALANAAAPTNTEGNLVLLSVDLAGNLRTSTTLSGTSAVNVAQWNGVAVGSPTAWGTAPTGNVIGVNSELFAGNTPLTQTTEGSPAVASLNVHLTNPAVAVSQSTSPWVVSGTVTANQGGTWTVQQGTPPWSFVGTLTNNNAAPGANNIGALTALANAANPTFTEGDLTLQSVDLSGHTRTVDKADGATGAAVPTTAIQVAGSDGTNLQAIRVSTNRTTVVIPADEALASSLSYFAADTGLTQVSSANPAITPAISIETNSASVIILFRGLSLVTNGTLTRWQIIKNGTLTGSTFATTISNAKIDTAATSISGGTVIDSGFTGSTSIIEKALNYAMAAGTPGDKFTITVASLSGTTKVSVSIQWSEQAAAL